MLDLPGQPTDEFAEWRSLAVAAVDVGIWLWDVPNKKIRFDEVWGDLIGINPWDIPKRRRGYLKRVHPDDRKRVKRRMRDFAYSNEWRWTSRHRLLHDDGTIRHVLSRGNVLDTTPEGTPAMVIGGDIDLTDYDEVV